MKKINLASWNGVLGLLGFVGVKGGVQALERDWVEMLILLAALVLLPIAMQQSGVLQKTGLRWVYALSSWALMLAFCLEPGIVAALLALPLLLFSLWLLVLAWSKWLLSAQNLADTAQFAAYLFWPVGTFAAFSDRLDWAPLGFSSIIILLTAAHFHYAGFLLPWVLSNIAREGSSYFFQKITGWGILAGIPAVAIGISGSNFGAPLLLESLSATIMALAGFGLAVWHCTLAFSNKVTLWRRLAVWGLGLCLGLGMILALLYGWRSHFSWPFLSIPWMYALHGTANTLGVGIFGVLLWGKTVPK